jgi:hypothetical protein
VAGNCLKSRITPAVTSAAAPLRLAPSTGANDGGARTIWIPQTDLHWFLGQAEEEASGAHQELRLPDLNRRRRRKL